MGQATPTASAPTTSLRSATQHIVSTLERLVHVPGESKQERLERITKIVNKSEMYVERFSKEKNVVPFSGNEIVHRMVLPMASTRMKELTEVWDGVNDDMRIELLQCIRTEGIVAAIFDGGLAKWSSRNFNERNQLAFILLHHATNADYEGRAREMEDFIELQMYQLMYLAYAQLSPNETNANMESARKYGLDALIVSTNVHDITTKFLLRYGLAETVIPIFMQTPMERFNYDNYPNEDHPDWWLAFDVVTNMAKWPSARRDLILAGVPKKLHQIMNTSDQDKYFAFEATEGASYLLDVLGVDAHDKECRLGDMYKTFSKISIDRFLARYHRILNGDIMFNGLGFGVFGRCLALRRLASNKTLIPSLGAGALTLLMGSLDSEIRCVSVALAGLRDLIRDPDLLKAFQSAYARKQEDEGFLNRFAGEENEIGIPVGVELALLLYPNPNISYGAGSRLFNRDHDASKRSLLSFAVEKSAAGTAMLLDAGADESVISSTNQSIYEYAVRGHCPEAAKLVLNNLLAKSTGPAVITLLTQFVILTNEPEIIRFLVAEGAEPVSSWVNMTNGRRRAYRSGVADRFVHFLFAQHPRLGAHCVRPLQKLDNNVLTKILDFLVVRADQIPDDIVQQNYGNRGNGGNGIEDGFLEDEEDDNDVIEQEGEVEDEDLNDDNAADPHMNAMDAFMNGN